MANYGQIFSTNDIAKHLKEANRTYDGLKTWEQLYGSVNLAEQQMISSLKQDYSKDIGQAYLSSLQQEQDILASNIGQGYKEQMLSENQLALEEAFAAYQQNYLQGVQSVSETAAKATSQITSQLEQQADYTKQFAEAQYGYLSHLYDEYEDTGLFNEDEWKRYLITEGEETRLKTWEELTRAAYNKHTDEQGNIVKEWTSLYDDQGNLTMVGADFYDQMMNQFGYEGKFITNSGTEYNIPSFGAWLNEENEELFNWATSYNPYNYTEAGTQQGSFKTLVGLTSTDYQYEFMERYTGLSKSELENKFTKYKEFKLSNGKSMSDLETVEELMTDIKTLAKTLGIDDELLKDIGDWETLQTVLTNSKNSMIDVKSMKNDLNSYEIESFVPGMFQAAGGFLENAGKFAYNLFAENDLKYREETERTKEISRRKAEISEAEKHNQQLVKDTEQAYINMVNSLISYSEQKRRQKQIDFYNNNK